MRYWGSFNHLKRLKLISDTSDINHIVKKKLMFERFLNKRFKINHENTEKNGLALWNNINNNLYDLNGS